MSDNASNPNLDRQRRDSEMSNTNETTETAAENDTDMAEKVPKKVSFDQGGQQLRARPAARGPDAQFQNFMNPMFAEMEERVKEHEKILDKMNEEMQAERLERKKAREQAHIPEPLKGSGKNMKEVMAVVEDLMLYELDDAAEKANGPAGDKRPVVMQTLDDHGHAAITSHSLAAYVSCLSDEHLRKFTSKITSDCQLWLSKMFRFDDASVVYHEEPRDGLVKVCRLALYQKYPKYATEGFEALYSRPPVIYLSSASRPGLSNYLCLQLGLPMSCICTVPCNTLFGANSKLKSNRHNQMDTEILEKLMQDDIAAAKTPVLLVAYAGTPVTGHVDDLSTLQELCQKNSVWLHVEGNNLATLALYQTPSSVESVRSGDSFTLTMGQWLGLPALPYITLFKASDPSLVHAAGLNSFNPSLKLVCLPLWVCLQTLGIEGIEQRITDACDLAKELFDLLEPIKSIKQISRETKKKEDDLAIRSVTDLIAKALSALLIFDIVTPTVVFKYIEDISENAGVTVAPYAMETELYEEGEEGAEDKAKRDNYYNALNAWLGDILQSDNPNVEVNLVDVEREGLCIRFAPLESAQFLRTKKEDIETFVTSLTKQIAILDATVLNYEKFRMIVAGEENLRVVEIPNWAGLGAVQYIPTEHLNSIDNLSERAVNEINNLNIELVYKLKSTDLAFSMGYTEEDMTCVKFGLITEETDIEELIGMVQSQGRDVEESSKYMESVSELIKKGIQEANKDLQLETQHKLVQEGVLRQVPLVGSLFNWWSPPAKNAVKGRTFNIVTGTISSTESTYKYHMQLQEDVTPTSSPRSSQSGSTSGQSPLPSPSPSPNTKSGQSPSPSTKSAADVKTKLLNSAQGVVANGRNSAQGVVTNGRESPELASSVGREEEYHSNIGVTIGNHEVQVPRNS